MKKLMVLTSALLLNLVAVQSHAGVYNVTADSTAERAGLNGASIFESRYKILVLIQGREIKSLKQLHATLADGLKLPKTYGANLDALYDVLTDPSVIKKNWDITIIGGKDLVENLGEAKVQALIDTLNDAQEQDRMNTFMYWL
ncbi:barstar family protein [Bdellovibrio sp. SKB1291214]|uniref:barstar family protein n=1 Tax=Bdellovibrio sp. SKB1291214 TaxID=1732569 RepID=UPI000B51B5BA|nr:barstar family protein [Bdellovibrio sp. SKB1291214]UYL09969.1 barstar family protein [Bdellovibrio sp. SKB1291214]